MGEKQNEPFQLSFNTSLKVDFLGSRVTSDGGLIVVREMDERLGLGDLIAEHMTDARRRLPDGTLDAALRNYGSTVVQGCYSKWLKRAKCKFWFE